MGKAEKRCLCLMGKAEKICLCLMGKAEKRPSNSSGGCQSSRVHKEKVQLPASYICIRLKLLALGSDHGRSPDGGIQVIFVL
jgi:hypothetical protein